MPIEAMGMAMILIDIAMPSCNLLGGGPQSVLPESPEVRKTIRLDAQMLSRQK
jgi:hypothetical protein